MDPHITKEDYENMNLEPLTHRYLRQSLTPPTTQAVKKKKFVNFKISRRRRSITDHVPVKYHSIANRHSIMHTQPIKEEVEEERYERQRDDDDIANGNDIQVVKSDESMSSISTVASQPTSPANGNIPSRWPQIPERQRPALNKTTTSNANANTKPRKLSECVPLTHRKSTESSWERLKTKTSTDSVRDKASLFNVVNVVVNKTRGTPAPSIWTPSVPRSQPSPRPSNWRDQEEPGSGSYIISFVCNVMQTKTKQQIKQMKFQSSSYYQESQSPRQRKKNAEFYGKQFAQWLGDTLRHPPFQDGDLMRGLEIGSEFPVVHITPEPQNYNKRNTPDPSSPLHHGGLGPDAIVSQGVYEEVVSWVPELLVACPSDPSQWARCFIVIGFKTLDGEFSRVEDQWREWTGALHIYFNICDDLGLKKLTFFRRKSPHHSSLFTYIVVVEVDTVTRENVLYLLDFAYRMRMKSMGGYIAVYQEHSSPAKANRGSHQKEAPILNSTTAGKFDSSVLDITRMNL